MSRLTRKQAADILGVSTRTVDRYIRSDKLSTFKIGGRIYLYKKDIYALIRQKNARSSKVNMSTFSSAKDSLDQVDTSSIDIVNFSNKKGFSEGNYFVYKKLYEDQRVEFIQNQKKLEFANYRIGFLEGELASSVSLKKVNELKALQREEKVQLNRQLTSQKKRLYTMTSQLQKTNLKKKIFFYFLWALLSFQPLWLYLSIKN